MGATETDTRQPVPDREPEPGDDAADTRNDRRMYVVAEHDRTAGEIFARGDSLAEHLDVDPQRRVVWVVFHEDLTRCDRHVDTHADVRDAIDAGVVMPTPFPVSLVAPLVGELEEEEEENDV
ncbi:hypothetical protein [Halobellus marinus]|uniref:hypothetical protein n=1 Tax=Halobellus sp. GCM10025813 TaxID=3252665 RepID=UPI00360FF4BE